MAQSINEDLSKRIISLRFLLIVFVVFIHNQITEVNFTDGTIVFEIPVYVEKIRYMLSEIISRIAVPLFFLISGYLLYAKETKFSDIIKKKSRTILLPYILWNILSIVFFFTAQSFSFTKMYFTSPQNIIRNFGWIDWIDVFVGKFTRAPYPLVYQFWFLRDLFILNVLSMGIKKMIDALPFGMFVVMGILWIGTIPIYIVSTEALFFFSMGYYIIKYSVDYKTIDSINSYDIAIIYSATILIELFYNDYVPMIHKINLIVGILFFVRMTYYFIRNEKAYKLLKWLEGYAFFVYAIHEPLLTVMKKLSVRIIPMNGGWILAQYFGVAIMGILVFLIIGIIIKKMAPKIYAVLTGGRM